jgi:hypothetical protein
MSRGIVNTFVLVVHFLNHNWEPGHVTIGLFEIIKTFRATMAIQVNEMLTTYGLNVRILTHVKDESNNLKTMTSVLTFSFFCELLGLTTPFIRSYWGYAMSKCFQYATDDIKVSIGLTSISIKNVNLFCKKPSPRPKKVEKGVKSGRKLVWIWTYIHTN